MRRHIGAVTIAGVMLAALLPGAAAAREPVVRPAGPLPDRIQQLKLDQPVHLTNQGGRLDRILAAATGQQRVIVRLKTAPAADVAALGAAAQRARVKAIGTEQSAFISKAKGLDRTARVLGRTSRASNMVMLRINARVLRTLAADPRVVSIHAVHDYQLSLSETVPYVGASAVQALGFTGDGIRVAVVDSGIDYTHAAFGGPGTLADYEAAYGTDPTDPRNTTTDGLFPTARVIGGYDFVGEAWVGGAGSPPEAPDPDPIDFDGHGTHVADIIGGAKGVAPDVSLYAVRACAALSTACSGVALIQAMDFALDPNGDGSTADHVDVINMSLGSLYGTAFDDDLSFAVNEASKLGVLSVTAAGNGSNKPYVLDTPSAAKSAFSVAQTAVPSAIQYQLRIVAPATIAGLYSAVFQPWSGALTGLVEAPLQYGNGAGGNLDGCVPFAAGTLTGKIVLVDRGTCNFSAKISNVEAGGGLIGVIGMIAPGDPFEGGFGGGTPPTIPGFMISQADSLTIKTGLAAGVTARFDPADGVPLVGSIVGSSSRGPSSDNLLKPEIGAPGASVSAVAGSGTGTEAFGGTSGATPMVTGAAALLQDAFPHRTPLEIKAVLMNTAETEIYTNPATQPGVLAPITRIGGGELRVDRALKSPVAIWNSRDKTGAVGFGFVDASDRTTRISRELTIRNYSKHRITYRISPTFRYADDAANGAVTLLTPRYITLDPRETRHITVTALVNGKKLRQWVLDSGGNGTNAAALDLLEYDGYLVFDNTRTHADDADPLHVAWHVLPRQADDVSASDNPVKINKKVASGDFAGLRSGTTRLHNRGVGSAAIDVYSLVATSPNLPPAARGTNAPIVDLKSVGVQTFPVPAGYCSADPSFVYVVAISTWERTAHANSPAEFDVLFDTNQDGVPDYDVFNFDLSLSTGLSDGRNAVWSLNLATGAAVAFFFTDHPTNGSNTLLTICGEQIGLNASNIYQPMTVDVDAFDWYYTGHLTDSVEGLVLAPLGERYYGIIGTDGPGSGDIAPFSSAKLTVVDFGAAGTNPSETGLLLILDAARADYHGAAPKGNEALRIRVRH